MVFNVLDYGFVGDGVTDNTAEFNAILAAASAAVAADPTIEFPRGVYLISGQFSLPGGVTLSGRGGTLKIAAGVETVFIADGDNTTVEGLNFDAALAATNAGFQWFEGHGFNFRLLNNNFYNIPYKAPDTAHQTFHVCVLQCSYAVLMGNFCNQAGGDMLNCNEGEYIVAFNKLSYSGDGAIAFNNNAHGIITNNLISYCHLGTGGGPEGNASDTDRTAHRMIISNNDISFCALGINMGWFGYAGRLGPTNFVVSGNTIKGCAARGIAYDGTNGALLGGVISDNSIMSLGESQSFWNTSMANEGIRVVGGVTTCTISGNTIVGCYSAGFVGINVQGNYITTTGNTIIGQQSSEPQKFATGIVCSGANHMMMSNNIHGANAGIVGLPLANSTVAYNQFV